MKPNIEDRDRLYYDQYQYRLGWWLPYTYLLRCRDHVEIESRVAVNRLFRTISPTDLEYVRRVFDLMPQISVPYKRVLHLDWVYFYTDHAQDIIDILAPHMPHRSYEYVRAEVTLPRDTILLQNPRHSLRTYLRDRQLDTVTGERLRQFFLTRRDHWGFSDAFRWRLDRAAHFQHMHDYFFFDHDDQRDCLMLEMAVPGIVRVTKPIRAK